MSNIFEVSSSRNFIRFGAEDLHHISSKMYGSFFSAANTTHLFKPSSMLASIQFNIGIPHSLKERNQNLLNHTNRLLTAKKWPCLRAAIPPRSQDLFFIVFI